MPGGKKTSSNKKIMFLLPEDKNILLFIVGKEKEEDLRNAKPVWDGIGQDQVGIGLDQYRIIPSWQMPSKCLAYAWQMLGICLAFAMHLPGICKASPDGMSREREELKSASNRYKKRQYSTIVHYIISQAAHKN